MCNQVSLTEYRSSLDLPLSDKDSRPSQMFGRHNLHWDLRWKLVTFLTTFCMTFHESKKYVFYHCSSCVHHHLLCCVNLSENNHKWGKIFVLCCPNTNCSIFICTSCKNVRVTLFTLAHVLQRRMSCCPSHLGQESRLFQALWWAYGLMTKDTSVY